VSFHKRQKMKMKIEAGMSFSVSQHSISKGSLELIKKTLNCGHIRSVKRDNTYKFEVRNFKDILRIIIPFFQKYQLETDKQKDFLLFVEASNIIKNHQHLTKAGILSLIDIGYKMNSNGKNRKYEKSDLLRIIGKLKV